MKEEDPIQAAAKIQRGLYEYAESLTDWAGKVSAVVVKQASALDLALWKKQGAKVRPDSHDILGKDAVEEIFLRLRDEQVGLIKSMPLAAANRVVDWAREAVEKGESWHGISERIREELVDMTEGHANLIARTETSRARANFTQARSMVTGSTHYVWHTVGDARVRPDHVALDGTVQAWDSPPISDRRMGRRAHPGCIYNCRCFAEPIFSR